MGVADDIHIRSRCDIDADGIWPNTSTARSKIADPCARWDLVQSDL